MTKQTTAKPVSTLVIKSSESGQVVNAVLDKFLKSKRYGKTIGCKNCPDKGFSEIPFSLTPSGLKNFKAICEFIKAELPIGKGAKVSKPWDKVKWNYLYRSLSELYIDHCSNILPNIELVQLPDKSFKLDIDSYILKRMELEDIGTEMPSYIYRLMGYFLMSDRDGGFDEDTNYYTCIVEAVFQLLKERVLADVCGEKADITEDLIKFCFSYDNCGELNKKFMNVFWDSEGSDAYNKKSLKIRKDFDKRLSKVKGFGSEAVQIEQERKKANDDLYAEGCFTAAQGCKEVILSYIPSFRKFYGLDELDELILN